MQQITTITYLNIELLILRTEVAINVSIQSICKGIQIPAQLEVKRIKEEPVFNEMVVVRTYRGEEQYFIPVYLVTAWLLSIPHKLVAPEKLPTLNKLQRTVQLEIWRHFFGILCTPVLRRPGLVGDFKSRNFVYNCCENSVREIQISTMSPYELAVETLIALSEMFGASSPCDTPLI
ncbi:hypothetical protein FDX10_22895 [Citrobacter sp. wls713]|uniref:hypothetical protein n=1 Tax=unclassified Citrobacter TaxID=2644389 RepID=UPI0010C981A7|nr:MULTISPECIES: hypothetical protein [unclassified Citrobacter]TKU59836.1 hypothetical protein FDX10_22895 [Citrobacter sp. wls713]TKV03645.1 hypothetical protein FDX07_02755 [Citrobacter sp. wls621]